MLTSQRSLFDIPEEICYLNAAAWSPLPISTVDVGRRAVAVKSRPWEMAAGLDEHQFERARRAAATLIKADVNDVALIPSVGYGVSTAAKALALPKGSRILVLDRDHTSPVLEWMARADEEQFDVETVTPGEDRDWTSALLDAITRPGAKPVALVSISNVHWSDGGLVDLDKVQEALRPLGAKLLVDATHGAGILPLDVRQLDPDFLVFPTYKWLLGPYGRAFLYVAKRHQNAVPLEQTSHGRKRVQAEDNVYFTDLDYVENARRFDMGERDYFISLDMAAASIELLLSWGLDPIRERCAMLTGEIAKGLLEKEVPVSLLQENLRTPNILSLGFPNGMPEGLAQNLARNNVYAAPRLGRLRISPHVYNTEADCARCVDVLSDILR